MADEPHTVSSAPTPPRGQKLGAKLASLFAYRPHLQRAKALGIVAVLALAMGGGYMGGTLHDHYNGGIVTSSVSNQKKIVTNQSELLSRIAKNVGNSVVSVNVSVANDTTDYGYYGFSSPQETQAAGTGIIISESGLVLTNRHVVPAGTTKVSVTLSDGTELDDVKVLGRTNASDSLDVAILKINDTEGHKLTPATLGDSSKVAVGDQVVAIGNALGQFQNTVTSGIISGFGRSITAGSSNNSNGSDTENLDNLFQTDAAINEGNSGGPLVNLNGQVIGMNTAIATDSQNIGFAIPMNDLQGLVQHAFATGKFERPYLGVRYIPLTADIAKQYKLTVNSGAYIAESADAATPTVVDGSPAQAAGLKVGDVITKVDGDTVDKGHSLTGLLGRHQPGDKVSLTVVNGKATRTVKATLGTAPTD